MRMSEAQNDDPKEPMDGDDAAAEGNRPKTLADFLEGYIGVVHSSENVPGGANMSVDSSKKFAEGLVKQYRRQQAELAKYLREKEQEQ